MHRLRARRLLASGGLLALTALFAAWTLLHLPGAETFDDVATIAAAAAAAGACAYAGLGQRGQFRRFWWLLAAACGAWAAGELIWTLDDLLTGSVPVASWADVAYLAATPLAVAALLVHPAVRGRALGRIRSVVDGLVLASAVFVVAWTLVLEPVQRHLHATSLAGVVTLAYPLGDVVIIYLVVLVIRGTTGGDRIDLWLLLSGLLLTALSDSVYTSLATGYDVGNVVDTGWFAGYLGIAAAGLYARGPHRSSAPRAAASALTPLAVGVSFLPVLGALLLVAVRMQLGLRSDGVTLSVTLALVLLVLLRQVLLVFDAARVDLPDGGVGDRLVVALGEARPRPSSTRTFGAGA